MGLMGRFQSSTNADDCLDARGLISDNFGHCSYDRSDGQHSENSTIAISAGIILKISAVNSTVISTVVSTVVSTATSPVIDSMVNIVINLKTNDDIVVMVNAVDSSPISPMKSSAINAVISTVVRTGISQVISAGTVITKNSIFGPR